MADFQTNGSGGSGLASQARELRPLLSANAITVERDRRLARENLDALERLGLFKLMVPERWGGHGASLTTVLEVAAELAKGCVSTAWVQVIIGGSSWIASLLPDRGQEEVFSAGAPRVCGVIMPTATTRRVDGGYVDTSAIQRFWRDINVATRHPHLAWAHNLELYGRVLLGVPGNITTGI